MEIRRKVPVSSQKLRRPVISRNPLALQTALHIRKEGVRGSAFFRLVQSTLPLRHEVALESSGGFPMTGAIGKVQPGQLAMSLLIACLLYTSRCV